MLGFPIHGKQKALEQCDKEVFHGGVGIVERIHPSRQDCVLLLRLGSLRVRRFFPNRRSA